MAGTILFLLLLSLLLVVSLFCLLTPLVAAGLICWRWHKQAIRAARS